MHIFLYQFLPCAGAQATRTVRPQYFTLLTITGAVYVSEIPAFYDPLIPSIRPYQVRTENNLICCRSKYGIVIMQSEKNPSVLQFDITLITTFTVGCCSQRMIRHNVNKTHHNISSKRYMQCQFHIMRDFRITCEYVDFFLRCDSVRFGRNSSRF
jgi:hypothetical protein